MLMHFISVYLLVAGFLFQIMLPNCANLYSPQHLAFKPRWTAKLNKTIGLSCIDQKRSRHKKLHTGAGRQECIKLSWAVMYHHAETE
ncbi:hypothetical protein BJ742DRAFT_373378 [Cladochytrium replicatum]|nr:hypothetical protein BJ742DRAFT_373378 [Cladochytrium replicatum]